MKALFRIRTSAAFFAATVGATATMHSQQLPKAEEIFAKHVAAIGGKDAIMKVSSIKTTMTMSIPAMGLVAPMENLTAAPNRLYSKTSLPGMGDVLQGFDGTTA